MSKESLGTREKIVKTPFCDPCEAGHPNKYSCDDISYKVFSYSSPRTYRLESS